MILNKIRRRSTIGTHNCSIEDGLSISDDLCVVLRYNRFFVSEDICLMLYDFLKDMWDILRLRYKNPADYFYTLPVILAILLLLGMINAADMSTLLGVSTAAAVFGVLVTVIKWLILSRVMRYVLSGNGAPRLPLWGFILASEALMIPELLVFYVPQITPLLMFWKTWVFWVQAVGLMQMGQVKVWTVFKGYLLYFCCMVLIIGILIQLFTLAGWFDKATLMQNFNALTAAMEQAR
jgi:hypothetical protein